MPYCLTGFGSGTVRLNRRGDSVEEGGMMGDVMVVEAAVFGFWLVVGMWNHTVDGGRRDCVAGRLTRGRISDLPIMDEA